MSLEQNWKEEAAEPQTAVTKQREFLMLWGGPVPPWPEAGLCSPPPALHLLPATVPLDEVSFVTLVGAGECLRVGPVPVVLRADCGQASN